MKKKFLLYVVVIITILFLGFTVYYIAKNDETISLTLKKEDSMYINEGESFGLPIKWTKPYKDTKMSVEIGNKNILSYSEESKMFTGIDGGFTSVTISTTNKNFGPFVFEVLVGDGELGSPFMIKSAEELAKIGSDAKFTSTKYYALANDINIEEIYVENNKVWNPLPAFSGNFNGNGYIIYNLNVANSTSGGLFSEITSAGVVENVKFSNVKINGEYDAVGTVAGTNSGLVGKVEVISGQITNNKQTGITGGVVGINKYNASPAYVNMCASTLSFVANGIVGGLVGKNISSVVLNSASIVNEINATSQEVVFGGIVGENASTYAEQEERYYPCAVVKSYAVVNKTTGESCTCGAVIGFNNDSNNDNAMFYNKFENIIYAMDANVSIEAIGSGVDKINNTVKAQITGKTKDALLNQTTYVNFNFDNVWAKQATSYAMPNFLGSYESVYIKGMSDEVTPKDFGLIEFLKEIKSTNSQGNVVTYLISSENILDIPAEQVHTDENGVTTITYDLKGESWATIAPSKESPLQASIIIEDGIICKITNFKIEGDNSSFFGYVSGNTKISNLVFADNIIVNSTNAEATAIVATALLNGATLDNIKVRNYSQFKAISKNVGIICADNYGTISNCSVNSEGIVNISPLSEQEVAMGGIVGNNAGLVNGSVVENVKLEINTTTISNGNLNIGGVAGVSSAIIKNSGVNAFTLTTSNSGTMYVGGIVGYISAGEALVEKSYSKATISLSMSSQNEYLAGVAGYVGGGATIYGCAYVNGTLRAYNVAGLVGINNGTISISYNDGTLHGNIVGGLTNKCYSGISNCYTLSTLEGDNKKSVVSGITSFVGPDCLIDRVFSSATLTGEGVKYAESESQFRCMYILRWLFQSTGRYDLGTLSNMIIINHGDANIQYEIFGLQDTFLDAEENVWIDVTEEDCKGKDDYAVMREVAGFDGSIWNFENVGEFPTLKDAVVVK